MINTKPTPRSLSPQQQAVIDFITNDRGSSFIEAVAGAGKTTTLLEALTATTGSVGFAAFNKKIADEIKLKIADRSNPRSDNYDPRFAALGNRVRVGTFHSFGLGAWRRVYPNVKVDADAKWLETVDALKVGKPLQGFVRRLLSLAKQNALGLHGSVDDVRRYYDIVEHHDMAYDLEDDSQLPQGIELAIKAMHWHVDNAARIVDFDDMIYMPVVTPTRIWQNDFVFVDEAQDTNPVRRALARKMLRSNGRAVFVGDRHQAIYGFCHPAGVPVLTAEGWQPVEKLVKGSPTIAFSTGGDVAGWQGGNAVKQTHVHENWHTVLRLKAEERYVDLTHHHRVPVKIDPKPCYFTYIMERNGSFRAGYCASHTTAGSGTERRFMFSQRCKLERATSGWLLDRFDTREEAIIAEARLHMAGIPGASFTYLTNKQVQGLKSKKVTDAVQRELYARHRMLDFPIWRHNRRHHFEINLPFVTEACNIVEGMRVQLLGDWDARRRGRSRHRGRWVPASISGIENPGGITYGITIKPISGRNGYQNWPLYAAGVGGGIIVHNTGADNDAIDQIIRDFNCKSLPLTVTYRCPKEVVKAAQTVVSHIEAHETAPEGSVTTIELAELIGRGTAKSNDDISADGWVGFEPSDAILCRKTKPLVEMAFQLIRSGVACHVEGRDIGAGLLKLLDKFKSANTLDDLLARLDVHVDRRVALLNAKGKESQAEALSDRAATIHCIAEKCDEVAQVRQHISSMFEDSDSQRKQTLTLSTVHKSKGREWPRVFILGKNAWMPGPWARQAWEVKQENNLIYVAYTRAQCELILVNVPVEG